MTRDGATFDTAPCAFARLLVQYLGPEVTAGGRILRDIYGRLSFVTDRPMDARQSAPLRDRLSDVLGAYGQPGDRAVVSLADDPGMFAQLVAEPSIAIHDEAPTRDSPIARLIDRRLSGDEWLMRPRSIIAVPPRLVFYSVKGGVGRSTGLAVAAADLANRGFSVLVLDMDLEAPGVGGLLLTEERMPEFGVADWFVAVAAGADAAALLPDMVGQSAFTDARAVVDVVPAHGRNAGDYFGKLARVFVPGSAGTDFAGRGFASKTDLLVRSLTDRRSYDAVLIDARAGLHESAAGMLLGLGAAVLIFGIDASQTFSDLELLFQALRQAFSPDNGGTDLRGDFGMVHAKAPRDVQDRRRFLERSWDVWTRNLYDDVSPEQEDAGGSLVFDINDEEAPHYPLEIIVDESFARFDPRSNSFPLSAHAYEPVFGEYLSGVRRKLGLRR